MNAAHRINFPFSSRHFAMGMGVVAILCGGLAGWSALKGRAVLSSHIATMPSRSAEILWPESVPSSPIIPQNHIAIDVPAPDITPPAPEEKSDPEITATPATPEIEQAAATDTQIITRDATPLVGLYETTQWGRLPIIRKEDKLTPFQAYRRPFDREAAGNKPIISVAVYGLGLSDSATNAALRLPPDISLILSPYMNTPELWTHEARERGHEIWLSLPLETKDYPLVDPGPQTALIGAPEKENLGKLYWTMGRATAYAGFVTPPDSSFVKSEADMRPFLTRIYGRGLGFIDGSLLPPLIPQTMARSMNGAYGTIDVWADHIVDEDSILDAFTQAEKLAARQGYAAVIIRPFPLSYKLLTEWLATLPEKNIILAPLSAQTGY